MVLLTVISVGLLTLAGISLRSSSQELLMMEARQNARLGLMLAIGELQTATGPDQRVTAAAGVRGAAVAQPHLTGVWKGWKWDGAGDAPDFKERKETDFVGWLASTARPETAAAPDFADAAPSGERARLVGGVLDAGDRVDAQVVPVMASGPGRSGAFAWAVFDESTKLPAALPADARKPGTPFAALDGMSAAAVPGYAVSPDSSWSALAESGADRLKLLTPGESALVGVRGEDRRFHDLTSGSAGLVADVAAGGLATDLSRLFDTSSLPADFASRFLYSDDVTPLAGPPTRFAGANPFPAPDPSWRLLHSHYRLYQSLSGGTTPTIDTTTTERPLAGTTGSRVTNHPFFRSQQLAPVISKAQFVFSLSFAYNEQSLRLSARPDNLSLPPNQKDNWITWLVTDPVITLWNPYNVNLRFPGGRVDLYRVPMAFRIYKNGTLINQEYTNFANTFWDYHFSTRASYYRLNLLPDQGKSEIVLAPGEHIVFTATNTAGHAGNSYADPGLDLRPGFTPPAGPNSRPGVGGVTTLNVCVAADSSDGGFDYGKKVRTVAVKAGDVIELDVIPQIVELAKPVETGDRDIAGFLKYYVGRPDSPKLVGGIEIDYGRNLQEFLPALTKRELPAIVVRGDIPMAGAQQGNPSPVVAFKEPFLITTFQLKTERDSRFPSRGWIHNSPTNLYASAGLDQREPWSTQQYEFQWEAMTDWPPASPTIEISNTGNRGYGGAGIYAQSGVEFATHSTIPVAPALSLPQLRHAPLNNGGQLPLSSQVVAGSFPSPVIPAGRAQQNSGNRVLLDHSYLANNALFDRTFFSGLATPGGPFAREQRAVDDAITGLFDESVPLSNPRFIPHRGGRTTEEIVGMLTDAKEGHLKAAAHLLIDSPFNVNSTRVDVWEAILASTFGKEVPLIVSGRMTVAAEEGTAASRHLPSGRAAYEAAKDPVARDLAKWNGHRRLEPAQIRRLAEEIVKEIQLRGPFQSLAEFVNRRPESGDLGRAGALQAAIERAGINDELLSPGYRTPLANPQAPPGQAAGVANPEALEGNTADGAPGIISQADLLTPIAPILTARGDTFRVRAYGEAGPADGPRARAWCEAVVQRVPEYLNPAEESWSPPVVPDNQRFGRRYEMVSFRWLDKREI
jgi:hypothetical protein